MNTIKNIPATKQDVETAIENAVDRLALMINEGFKGTPTKDDIHSVEIRLGKIENLLMEEQKGKIKNLAHWEKAWNGKQAESAGNNLV